MFGKEIKTDWQSDQGRNFLRYDCSGKKTIFEFDVIHVMVTGCLEEDIWQKTNILWLISKMTKKKKEIIILSSSFLWFFFSCIEFRLRNGVCSSMSVNGNDYKHKRHACIRIALSYHSTLSIKKTRREITLIK